MKLLIAAIGLLILSSCSMKMIPLKGNYQTPPLSTHSDNSVDTVWSRLIDFVSEKGIDVKIIDKASGLLITEDYNLKGNIAYETKKGPLSKPYAMVVTSMYKGSNGLVGPHKTIANWNVRIKPDGKGTNISVNITNIRTYSSYVWKGVTHVEENTEFDVRTLGNFEEMLFRFLR